MSNAEQDQLLYVQRRKGQAGREVSRGGEKKGEHANLLYKFSNVKSTNSWAHSAIANPQISLVCQSANADPQKILLARKLQILRSANVIGVLVR